MVSLTIRVSGLLCLLPILEKFHTLPTLLKQLAPIRPKQLVQDTLAMERAVRVVQRLCHCRIFRSELFPKACLRQSLVLYHVLTHMGFPVEFHVGVRKKGEEFIAHSWITLEEKPLADRTRPGIFKHVYCYPPKTTQDLHHSGDHYGKDKPFATVG
jgi:Transglutaminase-like superfamily